MYSRLPLLSLTGAGLVHFAQALSLPFTASSKDQVSDNTFSFQNVNNVSVGASIYTTELTINGKTFLVQLDTGSSDLWLDTTGVDVSQFEATGINTSITYGDGTEALGPILIGNVTMGTFSANQAFISAPGTNATTYNDKGLLGVGPPSLSQIATTLSSTNFDGDFFLQNVFDADPSLKEFISFQLSRSVSTGATEGGIFTVGEIASNLTAVSSSPQVEVVGTDRWTVLMDGIVVNGKNISGHSAFLNANIPGQTTQQTLATLDTGTGLATIPKKYADAIYGSVPGASFSKSNGVYFVPCDAVVNVSFVFGAIEYPIHPIDTVQAFQTTDGSIECISGFQPVDVDPSESTEDFLLGDSFLRNVYAVFNYGSFISGTESPSIQLLSTTNGATASSEFASLSAQRNQSLTEKATSSPNSSNSSGSSGSSSSSPASSSPSTNKKNAAVSSRTRIIGEWNGLLVLGLLGGILVL